MRLLFRLRWPVTMGSISNSSRAEPPPAKDEEAAVVPGEAAAARRADTGSSTTRGEASARGTGVAAIGREAEAVEMGGREGRERREEGEGEGVVVRVERVAGILVLSYD